MVNQRSLLSTLIASSVWLACGDVDTTPAISQGADASSPLIDSAEERGARASGLDTNAPEADATGPHDASPQGESDALLPSDSNAPPQAEPDATIVPRDAGPLSDAKPQEGADVDPGSEETPEGETGGEEDISEEAELSDAAQAPPSADASAGPDAESEPTPETINALCFSDIYDPASPTTDYDQFAPVIGSHCLGTNHQAITDIEQVVILGDSVTQGTPNDVHPTCLENEHFFRNILSEWLADTYGLDRGDLISWGIFKSYNCLYDGTPGKQTSGDFHNCSKWGARTDDFISGGGQIPQCFPGYPTVGSDKTTLVFFTMGGNDVAHINKKGAEASAEEVAAGYPSVWEAAESAIGYLEEAMAFLKDPAAFPAGVHVVFANPFEFTDGTGQTSACSPSEINIPFIGPLDISAFGLDLAGLAGYGPWEDQSAQAEIIIWMMEQYMRIAVDYQADLVWLLESFCGHGFVATGPDADTENPCYRGPDAELYFDISCTHPSKAGHKALSELFKAVIAE